VTDTLRGPRCRGDSTDTEEQRLAEFGSLFGDALVGRHHTVEGIRFQCSVGAAIEFVVLVQPPRSGHGEQAEVEAHLEGNGVVGAFELLVGFDGEAEFWRPAGGVVLFA